MEDWEAREGFEHHRLGQKMAGCRRRVRLWKSLVQPYGPEIEDRSMNCCNGFFSLFSKQRRTLSTARRPDSGDRPREKHCNFVQAQAS